MVLQIPVAAAGMPFPQIVLRVQSQLGYLPEMHPQDQPRFHHNFRQCWRESVRVHLILDGSRHICS